MNLLAFMQIHSIFYIFLLKSADSNILIQTETLEIDLKSQDVEYKVKNILNQQDIKDQSRYLIK